MDAPSVVGFETSREVVDDLKRLVVFTASIEILDEAVVVFCKVILSKILGQRLCKGTDELDLMYLIVQKLPLLPLFSWNVCELAPRYSISSSDY